MDESLAWLRAPEMDHALPDLLCGLIRTVRQILVHPDLGNAAKLAAITETVDQLAPPPGPQTAGARAAASVGTLLARNAGPATLLFERLSGEQVRIELTGRADRILTHAECHDLHAAQGTRGHQRTGTLRTADSGLAAAEVTSVIVPARLPASAKRALGIPSPEDPVPPVSDIPLGKALARLGVRREPLGVRLVYGSAGLPGTRVSVESTARIWLAAVPVALASERVTAEFCVRAGGRRASAAAGTVDSVVAEEVLGFGGGELGAVTGVDDEGGDRDVLLRVKGDQPAVGLFLA
jgi:hypothetical protein